MRTLIPTLVVALLFGAHTLLVNAESNKGGTKGLERAQEKMSPQGQAHQKATTKEKGKVGVKRVKRVFPASPASASGASAAPAKPAR